MMEAPAHRVRFDDFPALEEIAGRGFAPWGPPVTIGKDVTDAFSQVIDVVPGGKTIPGFLLLSLLPRIVPPNDWIVTGHSGAINLGCPACRFPSTAPIGAAVRGRSRLASARPHPKGALIALEFEAREDSAEIPCLTTTVELLYLGGTA